MPNHIVLASGAIVAVSVVVATAMAIYENEDVRRYSDDVRRRIALTLQNLGEGIQPPAREPRFNRPEDAEGFMQSRNGPGAEPGVDADEESRRRQREELLYWNSLRLQKKETEGEIPAMEGSEEAPRARRGSSFDDFLKPANDSEQGAYVFNSGTQVHDGQDELRHRGAAGATGAAAATVYANPFADEFGISHDELEDQPPQQPVQAPVIPGAYEGMSDIYSATTREDHLTTTGTIQPSASPALIDIEESEPTRSATLERQLGPDEYMTASQDDRHEAYASIQAWAQDTSRDFYSPLPVTPLAPASEAEEASDGQLTPTDSISIVGSGEDIASETYSSHSQVGESGRPYDVMSESEGMMTPADWSEVGSVISSNEDAALPYNAQHPLQSNPSSH